MTTSDDGVGINELENYEILWQQSLDETNVQLLATHKNRDRKKAFEIFSNCAPSVLAFFMLQSIAPNLFSKFDREYASLS